MRFHRKPVPLIRIIFLQTHPPVCRVAYGVAPVDSQKGVSGGRKGKGGKGGGKGQKICGQRGKVKKIEKLRVWRETKVDTPLELTFLSLPRTVEPKRRRVGE
jgi:hypothetical protein